MLWAGSRRVSAVKYAKVRLVAHSPGPSPFGFVVDEILMASA